MDDFFKKYMPKYKLLFVGGPMDGDVVCQNDLNTLSIEVTMQERRHLYELSPSKDSYIYIGPIELYE